VRRNTKKLQDLDLARSPHLERDSIGEALDLDLLSPFPKNMQQIVEGSRGGSKNPRSTMEEREWRGRVSWTGGGREV
jgi:hypothetical protein